MFLKKFLNQPNLVGTVLIVLMVFSGFVYAFAFDGFNVETATGGEVEAWLAAAGGGGSGGDEPEPDPCDCMAQKDSECGYCDDNNLAACDNMSNSVGCHSDCAGRPEDGSGFVPCGACQYEQVCPTEHNDRCGGQQATCVRRPPNNFID